MWIILLLGLMMGAGPPASQGQQAQQAYPLEAIQVSGNKRYTAAQVVAQSGLTPGQPVTIAQLNATLSRMASTGLFAKVGYRYAPDATGDRLIVTYEIEEPEWTMPVLFDNFVWFTDDQLTAAVAGDVPTFDGTLPLTDGAHDMVVRSLRSFLKTQGLDRDVAFIPHQNLQTRAMQFVFKVVDPRLRVCALRLDGASPAWQKRLAPAVAAQVGLEYSRASLAGFLTGDLQDMYRRHGHLDGAVGATVARLDDACDGVSIVVPVSEGDEYKWERASWTGLSVLAATDLDRLLGVRAGAVAETSALDPGLAAVREAYGRIGHVQAKVTFTTHGDPATKRAHLQMHVDEGPQFRMGTLQFTGLPDNDAADLSRRWKLKPGDVFDSTYIAEFRRSHIGPVQQRRRLVARGPALTADLNKKVVNVRYEFRPPGGDR